jgi:hypothetical protein
MQKHTAGVADYRLYPNRLAMARRYMRLLVRLVSDWEGRFYDNAGPGAPPTAGNTTPEELEEALGLPVGWTDGAGLSNEQRVRLSLRYVPPPISLAELRSRYWIK